MGLDACVALVAVFCPCDFAYIDRGGRTEQDVIGHRIRSIAVGDTLNRIVFIGLDANRIGAGQQGLSLQFTIARSKRRCIVNGRQVGRWNAGGKGIGVTAIGVRYRGRDEVTLRGDHALVIKSRPGEHYAGGI